MNTTQFTAGPWSTQEWKSPLGFHIEVNATHYSKPGILDGRDSVAKIHPSGSVEEQKANAQLIAAAPELYAALRLILNEYGMNEGAISESAWDYSHDVLEKALGKQEVRS